MERGLVVNVLGCESILHGFEFGWHIFIYLFDLSSLIMLNRVRFLNLFAASLRSTHVDCWSFSNNYAAIVAIIIFFVLHVDLNETFDFCFEILTVSYNYSDAMQMICRWVINGYKTLEQETRLCFAPLLFIETTFNKIRTRVINSAVKHLLHCATDIVKELVWY